MITISGIRGIVGKTMIPPLITQVITTYCEYLIQLHGSERSKHIILGRDSRASGEAFCRMAQGVIASMGLDCVEIGIVPTPTVQWKVIESQALGGIIITSSHNPEPWNGLKFVDTDGLFLSPDHCSALFARLGIAFRTPTLSLLDDASALPSCTAIHNGFGAILEERLVEQQHVAAILTLPHIVPHLDTIRGRKFNVVIDAIHGAGGSALTFLLRQLNCTVTGLYVEPSGHFVHPPEPLPSHLSALCAAVLEYHADLGIAVDPDADRCVLVDERGVCIGEEYTLAIAADVVLRIFGERGILCKNLSTSRAIDDLAAAYNCSVHAAPVGEIHVATEMVQCLSILGGEGNGGVMYPPLHIGRDSLMAAAFTLLWLATCPLPFSGAKETLLPNYVIVKKKIDLEGKDVSALIENIKRLLDREFLKEFGPFHFNGKDGIHISCEKWWVHLRKSNTEPIIRIICEAKTEKLANDISDFFSLHLF